MWPNKVSPCLNDSPVSVDKNKGSTLRRELVGLMDKQKEKRYKHTDCGNRLIHWSSLYDLVSQNSCCKLCGGDIELTKTTIRIATQVTLSCQRCKLKKSNFVRESNFKKMKKFERKATMMCH